MEQTLTVAVSALTGLFIGSFLPAYMKRKGENLATHEDINKLVDQVSAVTQATKEIESKISNEVWQRQQRWELRREALFAVAKAVSEMDDALLAIHSAKSTSTPQNQAFVLPHISAAVDDWKKASTNADAASVQAYLVCSKEVTASFHAATLLMRSMAKELFQDNLTKYPESRAQISRAVMTTIVAVRKELGIDEPTAQLTTLSKNNS